MASLSYALSNVKQLKSMVTICLLALKVPFFTVLKITSTLHLVDGLKNVKITAYFESI